MSPINPTRAGRYIQQPSGYKAFIPKSLPPEPALDMNPQIQVLLSEADRAIGRLDAATELLPNPDLFVGMYVRKEAVYSSQIEGTQASLADLLEYEAEAVRKQRIPDIQEVVNYVFALRYGLSRLNELPFSLRLLREIHSKLLEGVRGGQREPGEFRRSQNWIGPRGSTIQTAIFVPPPPQELMLHLGNLELFLIKEAPVLPPLIKYGLAHAQFETIHPFLDGNGRMGRLLITFMLCWQGILKQPLLYLSDYFRRHRNDYYDRLQNIRDQGDWESWMEFFLTGIRSVSLEAIETARKIQALREKHRTLIGQKFSYTAIGLNLLDYLFERPYVSVNQIAGHINRSYPIANNLTSDFEELGLLHETTGQYRNRVYAYKPYLDLLE